MRSTKPLESSHGRAVPPRAISSRTTRRPGSSTVECPRRASSSIRVDLPPLEQPEITTKVDRSASDAVEHLYRMVRAGLGTHLVSAQENQPQRSFRPVNFGRAVVPPWMGTAAGPRVPPLGRDGRIGGYRAIKSHSGWLCAAGADPHRLIAEGAKGRLSPFAWLIIPLLRKVGFPEE
jgi:hypothetical protein